MDFTVTEEVHGKHFVTELKPGGRVISVTNENKLQYVHAMADYKLNRQVRHVFLYLFGYINVHLSADSVNFLVNFSAASFGKCIL